MRTINFRGLRTDGKGWVYGYYWVTKNKHIHLIKDNLSGEDYEVHHESVAQLTGLTDKNGVDVYEGDIVVYFFEESVIDHRLIKKRGYEIGVVTYQNCGFFIGKEDDITIGCFSDKDSEFEVIGNIHENKEFLL